MKNIHTRTQFVKPADFRWLKIIFQKHKHISVLCVCVYDSFVRPIHVEYVKW